MKILGSDREYVYSLEYKSSNLEEYHTLGVWEYHEDAVKEMHRLTSLVRDNNSKVTETVDGCRLTVYNDIEISYVKYYKITCSEFHRH